MSKRTKPAQSLMRSVQSFVLVGIGVGAVVGLLLWKTTPVEERPALPPPQSIAARSAPNIAAKQSNSWPSFAMRAADMTREEKGALTNKFTAKFHPAFTKWFAAYESRIPFRSEEFTLDRFHSRFGTYMYTFVIGDATVTIQDPRDSNAAAKVAYLMVRKAALEMNRLPTNTFVPNLTLPVTSEEIIRMVKADSGIEFKPNEVLIKPTAKACALNGGAFVDLLPSGADPNNGLNYKISMVFDADGKLVNYERDPFF